MKPIAKSHAPSPALPFGEPERPSNLYTAHIDGAARGNPGPASYAVVLRGPDGATKWQIGKYIGRVTNNVAEYYALIAALDYATEHKIERLRVISDSELLVRQMQGRYKVKSPDLKPLHERAQKMARALGFFAIEHVRRERNADADALANVALDRTSSSAPSLTSASSSPSRSISSSHATSSSHSVGRSSSSAEPRIANTPHMRDASGERQTPREQGSSMDRKIQARYSNGALHPNEPLELAEGETVEIHIRRK